MSNRKIIFGVILILVGILLLGRSMDLFFFSFRDFSSFLLPLILILLGFWLIVRKKRSEDLRSAEIHGEYTVDDEPQGSTSETGHQSHHQESHTRRYTDPPSFSAPGKLKYAKTFGDIYIDCTNVDMQALEVSTVFGDIEVKLHGGRLTKGLNRMVISGFIGDVRILVPKDMPIFAQCSNFIGDVELLGNRTSGFGNNIDGQSDNYDQAESKLYIATNNFIGDIRVYIV